MTFARAYLTVRLAHWTISYINETGEMNLILKRAIAGIALALAFSPAYAKQPRNKEAIREFRATHPCPSTGRYAGHCTGWIIDHRVALCVGGVDEPTNMRWQTFDKSHLKDKWECRPGWQKKLAECEAHGCFAPD